MGGSHTDWVLAATVTQLVWVSMFWRRSASAALRRDEMANGSPDRERFRFFARDCQKTLESEFCPPLTQPPPPGERTFNRFPAFGKDETCDQRIDRVIFRAIATNLIIEFPTGG